MVNYNFDSHGKEFCFFCVCVQIWRSLGLKSGWLVDNWCCNSCSAVGENVDSGLQLLFFPVTWECACWADNCMYIQAPAERCFNTYTHTLLLRQIFLNSYVVVQPAPSLWNFFVSAGCPFRTGQTEEGCPPRVPRLWVFPLAAFPARLQVMKAKAWRKTRSPFRWFGTGDLT